LFHKATYSDIYSSDQYFEAVPEEDTLDRDLNWDTTRALRRRRAWLYQETTFLGQGTLVQKCADTIDLLEASGAEWP